MGEGRARLGALFPHVAVLTVDARLRLDELLAVPGASPALLPKELLDLPLPASRDGQFALRGVIESGLTPDAIARLGGRTLAEVVPPLARLEEPLGVWSCPTRLVEALRREGVTDGAALGALTLDAIGSWTGIGPRSVVRLVAAAVDAGLRVLIGAVPIPSPAATGGPALAEPPCSNGLLSDLLLVLDHDRRHGPGALRGAIDALAANGHPQPVREAAARLLAAGAVPDPRVAWLDQLLGTAGQRRDRAAFEHLELRLDEGCSPQELGDALGISRERVRQLRARAADRVGLAAAHGPSDLRDLAAETRCHLGTAVPRTAVDELLTAWHLPALPDPRSLLLLWLAGPYLPVAGCTGWLAVEPADVAVRSRRVLHGDGGVRPGDQVRADLEAEGIAGHHVDAWLAAQDAIVVDGLLLARTGSFADVAERVLSATGRPMSSEELSSAAGRRFGADVAAAHAGLRRDPRFVRVERDRFELAEWGGAPWDGANQGAAEGRAWLRVDLDQSALSGSPGPVPLPFLEAVGISPGGRRTFSTRFGPVALSRAGDRPTRGSIRPVALAAGAASGDALLLGFDPDGGQAVVELVPAAAAVPDN